MVSVEARAQAEPAAPGPPRFWLLGLGVLLLAAAIMAPVGLLPRADPLHLPSQIDLDALFLFYLPGALQLPPAILVTFAAIFVAVVVAVPWLLGLRRPGPVAVNPERCTGCTLCQSDCPYQAISMGPRTDGRPYPYLAQVDPTRCVSCGICIGSCLPVALSLDGRSEDELWHTVLAAASKRGAQPVRLVFVCERQALQGAAPFIGGGRKHDAVVRIVPLICAAMANPALVSDAMQAGAAGVQFVGCPPEDCRNRLGNRWQQERLDRERPPRLRAAHPGVLTSDWLPPNEFERALASPGSQSGATATTMALTGLSWVRFIPSLLLVAAVLGVLVLLSQTPYTPFLDNQAVLALSLEHRIGNPISGARVDAQGDPGEVTRVVLEVDDEPILDEAYRGPRVREFVQVPLPVGNPRLRLLVYDRTGQVDPAVLYEGQVELLGREVMPLRFEDLRLGGDAELGRRLFNEASVGANAGCRICHSLRSGVNSVGPSLAGIAARAGERIPGVGAEAYLRQSILEPDAFVVEGYPEGQMLPDLGDMLTPEQLDDLIAFLMTLK